MKKQNIGLLGYGTVGKGVEILLKNQPYMRLQAIFRRAGKASGPLMTDQIDALLNDPKIDSIVEAMGGIEPAHTYLKQAILNHKNVITANKALVNAYGEELNQLAIQNKVSFIFSAACGGGIPYLPTLVEAKVTSPIDEVGGILNGTTNFIIDKMEREGLPFEEALKQAQALGYAEADPTSDLNGTDTSYKLRLALAVGCSVWIEQDSILVAGIQNLSAEDILFFKKRHWVLRLLAHGKESYGRFSATVEPTLLSPSSQEASILENNNLAWFKAFGSTQRTILTGQGAGSIPTATNVLRDLNAIQNGRPGFLKDSSIRFLPQSMHSQVADNGIDGGSYYVRMDQSINSAFLTRNTGETWENEAYRVIITGFVQTKALHEEIRKLSQQGEIFFAKIAERGQYESQ